jgi:hypothetical protein
VRKKKWEKEEKKVKFCSYFPPVSKDCN